DLIRARTDKGMRLALDQVEGGLSRWVGELREELLDILVQIEAAIDFPEEEIELLAREQLANKIGSLREKLAGLIASYEWGRLFREGARVCIGGRPNVGKSSLLNALLGEERVIVTPEPGTTRDVIEESINLGGLPVVLWDTAGIRESSDQVERIGVDFALRRVEAAEAVMVVLDGSFSLTSEDRFIMGVVKGKKGLAVVNKSDLPQCLDLHEARSLLDGKTVLSVSAKSGQGLDKLRHHLRALLLGVQQEPAVAITNVRHKAALERTEKSLGEAAEALTRRLPAEIVAVDLQEAREGLEEVVGPVTNQDILERIFSQFCIGK
ncbi:MAG: GTP-binding protein, partial [Deltaproteobacteria bacterium]|nr:GTP-binding protein [Deltaproteobacteria bacterium]